MKKFTQNEDLRRIYAVLASCTNDKAELLPLDEVKELFPILLEEMIFLMQDTTNTDGDAVRSISFHVQNICDAFDSENHHTLIMQIARIISLCFARDRDFLPILKTLF